METSVAKQLRSKDGFPQLPQIDPISTAKSAQKALDSCGFRSNIPFIGGAILQKERVNKELSRGPETELSVANGKLDAS